MRPSPRIGDLIRQAVGDPDPSKRLHAITQLRRELDALEIESTADALRAGFSWRRIGEALGISKQAAHRRHSKEVSEIDRAAATEESGNVAIVSPEARLAVRIARREAGMTGQRVLGTEHLLLGLLQCGDARTVELLRQLGISTAGVRGAVHSTLEVTLEDAQSAVAAREGDQAPEQEAVLSPHTRRVVSRALRETVDRGSPSLTALDLLHALLIEEHGGASQTLIALGVSPSAVRDEIARVERALVPRD
jgi:hypothetical protein